ncbi:endolytic transglycosylase MltG [Microbacterium sp. NPDC096154]|uniref:endolytic transglycosylase MltG n=1 Tax=Microbacterium sp. NPDC096154 TaxID=3155549 RepID=UPI0033174F46
MTDPSPDANAPLSRRRLREAARSNGAPALPGAAASDVVGRRPAEGEPAPQPAETAIPWEDVLPRESSAPAPSERSAPATLAETAALTAQEPADGPTPAGAGAASLEDLFVPENMVDSKPRRRGRGCLVTLVVFALIAGGLTAGGFWAWDTYGERIQSFLGWDGPSDYEPGEATGEAIITIEEGDGGEAISQTLYEAGVTLKPDSFYDHLIDAGTVPVFYPGVYKLQKKMTSEAALEWLNRPETRLENSVALQEGWTVEATLEAAAAGLEMPLEELQSAAADPAAYDVEADSLEGWLFPAHYTFDPGVTAEDVIRTMVDRTRESLAAAGVQAGDEQRILTVASIVQREGRSAQDFRMVARVIYNRLDPAISDTNQMLQMDSTAQYGYQEEHGSVFSSEEQLTDPNPWNTYVHPGLPVGPIANPGDEAIRAAVAPADGDWQYFVTVNLETGETAFSATYGEQQQNEAKLRQWCSENPDYTGC